MAWCSNAFKYFPQFVVIHKVKGFSVVNEAEVDIFLECISESDKLTGFKINTHMQQKSVAFLYTNKGIPEKHILLLH